MSAGIGAAKSVAGRGMGMLTGRSRDKRASNEDMDDKDGESKAGGLRRDSSGGFSKGVVIGGGRHEGRGAMAVASLMLTISESRKPLRLIDLSDNRFREAEIASLLAATAEQNAENASAVEVGEEAGWQPLVLDFERLREEVEVSSEK